LASDKEVTMAVAVVIEFPGGTTEQYDEVIAKMGFTPGGKGAPGGLFHWVTMTDDGPRITDVWESREAFEKFTEVKTGPITAEVGVPGPPKITVYEIYNYLTAG
jgi:hypothetical protein